MFLEIWMQIAIVAAFGGCAYLSYKQGTKAGVMIGTNTTLEMLASIGVIEIQEGGMIRGGLIDEKKPRTRKKTKKSVDPENDI